MLKFIGITTSRAAKFMVFGCIAMITFGIFNYLQYSDQYIGNFVIFTQVFGLIFLSSLLILSLWVLVSHTGKTLLLDIKNEPDIGMTAGRILKIIFACYAVALALFIITVITGLFLTGPEFSEDMFTKYSFVFFPIVMAISFPFVNKKLS